ncbi:hypothetical protein FOCC_FOCC013477 [Frankliniella occidentalis]|nr:hypothetical protein FOCC_FOCC013477 [Frankliniella occidentalis]
MGLQVLCDGAPLSAVSTTDPSTGLSNLRFVATKAGRMTFRLENAAVKPALSFRLQRAEMGVDDSWADLTADRIKGTLETYILQIQKTEILGNFFEKNFNVGSIYIVHVERCSNTSYAWEKMAHIGSHLVPQSKLVEELLVTKPEDHSDSAPGDGSVQAKESRSTLPELGDACPVGAAPIPVVGSTIAYDPTVLTVGRIRPGKKLAPPSSQSAKYHIHSDLGNWSLQFDVFVLGERPPSA